MSIKTQQLKTRIHNYADGECKIERFAIIRNDKRIGTVQKHMHSGVKPFYHSFSGKDIVSNIIKFPNSYEIRQTNSITSAIQIISEQHT